MCVYTYLDSQDLYSKITNLSKDELSRISQSHIIRNTFKHKKFDFYIGCDPSRFVRIVKTDGVEITDTFMKKINIFSRLEFNLRNPVTIRGFLFNQKISDYLSSNLKSKITIKSEEFLNLIKPREITKP